MLAMDDMAILEEVGVWNSSFKAPNVRDLFYQRYCQSGAEVVPEGEPQMCRLRKERHNGKLAWDLDMRHSFCWLKDEMHESGGYWVCANLHRAQDGEGSSGVYFRLLYELPHDANVEQTSHPPLNVWLRGRPWNCTRRFPRNGETQFTLTRATFDAD